jgi:hypothetical protein
LLELQRFFSSASEVTGRKSTMKRQEANHCAEKDEQRIKKKTSKDSERAVKIQNTSKKESERAAKNQKDQQRFKKTSKDPERPAKNQKD